MTTSKPQFNFKVVIAGPFAAGKTTMIRAASDIPLVGTEAPTSGAEADVKATTTVGMEFGTLRRETPSFSSELHLYGVPGQERFSFMWDIVSVGMDGAFILVDASRPETWADSQKVGHYFQYLSGKPTVFGINHRAMTEPPPIEQVRDAIGAEAAHFLSFDVTDQEQARSALMELLLEILYSEMTPEKSVA